MRFGGGVHTDMTSVWLVAAGMALAPGYAVCVVLSVRTCVWLLYLRRVGAKPYRQVFTAASMVLACLGIGAVLARLGLAAGSIPSDLRAALAVLLAISVYIVINRTLVVGAICIASRSASISMFVQTWEDNALELATLSLGGIAALLVTGHPWLTVLVLAPMFALQRSAMVKEFREAAMTDAKTGLLNAVAWQQLAQRELLRASRDRVGAALLIIDLDHFKDVNDAHGHLAGDDVLKAVADCLRRELRDYDAVGRFGGEEFVALLPGADVSEGILVAERLRVAISMIPLPEHASEDVVAMVTSSIGLACYPEHGVEVEDLLHAADSAMYAGKRAGRNRVVVSSIDTKLGDE